LRDIQHADLIVVLDEGRVVQQGSHEALMHQAGWYRDNYRLQALESQPGEGAPAVVVHGIGS
jgi:ATP-binding cassette subfamily B protein